MLSIRTVQPKQVIAAEHLFFVSETASQALHVAPGLPSGASPPPRLCILSLAFFLSFSHSLTHSLTRLLARSLARSSAEVAVV